MRMSEMDLPCVHCSAQVVGDDVNAVDSKPVSNEDNDDAASKYCSNTRRSAELNVELGDEEEEDGEGAVDGADVDEEEEDGGDDEGATDDCGHILGPCNLFCAGDGGLLSPYENA